MEAICCFLATSNHSPLHSPRHESNLYMKRSDFQASEEQIPAPLQLEDIAGAEVDESSSGLHFWNKLLEVSHKAPLDGTDLTNRNLLNSLNTSVEGSSGLMSKMRSLRESIPEIKRELGVVVEDEDMGDSFRTPPGSRAPLRTGTDTQSQAMSRQMASSKRPPDPQVIASTIIDLATAGKGQVDPRMEVTPEIVSEILGQLQQEPTVEDIVDFIRRVRVASGKSSSKSTERLTTWLSEKRMRNSELEQKLRESQLEHSRLDSELKRLQEKTLVMQKALREMIGLMTDMNERYNADKEKKSKIMTEMTSSEDHSQVLVLKKALQDSEKQLTEAQSQLDRKRQHTLELELQLSQLQAVSSVASQTDSDAEITNLEEENGEILNQLDHNMQLLEEINREYEVKTQQSERNRELDGLLEAEKGKLVKIRAVTKQLADRAAQALASNR